jgi:hypothetical protein
MTIDPLETTEIGPGITAKVVDGDAEIHVDLPTFAKHVGVPESEAEDLVADACREALVKVFGDEAKDIPIEIREDA